jgi:hypothetical protein
MRTVGILFGLCLFLGLGAGCKSKSADAGPDPAALKAQQELAAKRDALLAQRSKLQDESSKLDEQIVQIRASGGDTQELEKKKQDIDTQIAQQSTNLEAAASELTKVASQIEGAQGAALQREASLARREAAIAERERAANAKLVELKELIALEQKNAEKWKEGCAAGAAPVIVQQVAPPRSADGKYTRKEVATVVSRAKSAMAKKGLISADLNGIDGDVTKAMSDGDWTRAYILASQWAQTVDQTKINRAFIGAKYQRLQNRVKAARLDEATQASLTDGMKEVLQKYGDGDHQGANRRINQLWTQVK